jgi:hydrogenase maturation protease
MNDPDTPLLVLGIGNILMGDEGVGPAVVREIERHPLPPGVRCLDGGTGSFALLGPLQATRRVILVDACNDGAQTGTLRRLFPRFSSDYPPTLTAHDIGLKDLLDALYILGDPPHVTLFAVSIRFPQPMRLGLSPELGASLPRIARDVLEETRHLAA